MSSNVYLSIAEKYEILLMKDRGVTQNAIINRYGISKSTLRNIFTNRENIIRKFETDMSGKCSKKILPWGNFEKVDYVVKHWYLRCKNRKVQLSGLDIQQKAAEMNKKLNKPNDFKASKIWLQGFKQRHNITAKEMRDDYPIEMELEKAEQFTDYFIKFLQEIPCELENVYNAVYTELIWKAVPENTCMSNHAKSTKGMCEKYVTALFCANATGCHKLPVLIIDSRTPTLKTIAYTTIYVSNTSGCMDSIIFKQWYAEHFLPSVKKRQKEDGIRGQCLLLLDNVMSLHNIEDDFYKINKLVRIMIPPINIVTLSQPMNSGIITCFKRKYRMKLLETMKPLPFCNTEEKVTYHYKEFDMIACCRIVNDAWACVNNTVITSSWDDLLLSKTDRNQKYIEGWQADIHKAVELLHRIPGCQMCDKDDVLSWFHIDNGRDIIMKACTDGVIQEYIEGILGLANED